MGLSKLFETVKSSHALCVCASLMAVVGGGLSGRGRLRLAASETARKLESSGSDQLCRCAIIRGHPLESVLV